MKTGYVYIVTNNARTLYIGVTSDLEKRMAQHRQGIFKGFSHRYGLTTLVYCESCPDMAAAIAREKQLKAWSRDKKLALIRKLNPDWRDLSDLPLLSDPSTSPC